MRLLRPAARTILKWTNLTVPTRVGGVTFRVPILGGIGHANLFRFRDRWMTPLLSRLFDARAGAFLDVGANIGQTLLDAKRADPSRAYVGFEPSSVCVAYLHRLIEENQLHGCTIVPAALSDSPKLIELVAAGDADLAASTLRDLRPGRTSNRSELVVALRLDDTKFAEGEVSAIKIDVEGAELEVVQGMTSLLERTRPPVVCEVLHAHSEAQLDWLAARNGQLMALLTGLGYEAHRIVKAADGRSMHGIERLACFDRAVWDSRSSPAQCDHLFVPAEQSAHLRRALLH